MARNKFVFCCVSVLAGALFGVGAVPSAAPAAAQDLLSESAARTALEDAYGVQVLRITADEQDGVPVFVVRVMNPGGNFNEAFMVSVLVVDRRTGDLVPQFRHEPSGVRDATGVRRDTTEDSGPILRRESVR